MLQEKVDFEIANLFNRVSDEKRAQIPIPVLQLRDHRLMKRDSGHVVWPPNWVKIGDKSPSHTGEIGQLENVSKSEASDETLYLFITHRGAKYVGALTFDRSTFCNQLCELLKSKIGLSIKEIGDLDLSYLL